MILMQHLAPVEELEAIARQHSLMMVSSTLTCRVNDATTGDEDVVVDSRSITLLVLKSMTKWLFDVEFKKEWEELVECVEQWVNQSLSL